MSALTLQERIRSVTIALIDEALRAGSEEVGILIKRSANGWTVSVSGTGKWQSWFHGDMPSKATEGGPDATAPKTTPDAPASPLNGAGLAQSRDSETQGGQGNHI